VGRFKGGLEEKRAAERRVLEGRWLKKAGS
jgi:hypothetical protein